MNHHAARRQTADLHVLLDGSFDQVSGPGLTQVRGAASYDNVGRRARCRQALDGALEEVDQSPDTLPFILNLEDVLDFPGLDILVPALVQLKLATETGVAAETDEVRVQDLLVPD